MTGRKRSRQFLVCYTGKLEVEEGLSMDVEKTKAFYGRIKFTDLCGCVYCQNYISEIKTSYPALAGYLDHLGIDIEKPFETMPLEPDEAGYIEYICSQYIVCGSTDGFEKTVIDSVNVDISECHPSTNMEEAHFVIDIYPVRLKWGI